MLTQKRLQELFNYQADRGALVWKHRPPKDFDALSNWKTWNKRFAGMVAGTCVNGSYVSITLGGRTYRAHRLVFLHVHGYLPKEVDHINGIRSDNRINNLRAADKTINGKNQKLKSTNTSGVVGVHMNKEAKKWQSSIRVGGRKGKKLYLGIFSNFDEACAARAAAEAKYGFHPNHGRSV
jgi:hypothetical protein